MANFEHHPLQPFLPQNAKVLFLGSFPPPKTRWSIDFFYPNFQNDMWRIFGMLFYDNPQEFIIPTQKNFDYEKIVGFCNQIGLAIFDTASVVKRLKGNASDKFLEIVEPTNLENLLLQIPKCKVIVTTGEKATDVLVNKYNCQKPSIGFSETISIGGKNYLFYRMPSSSRAYPLALPKKAEIYSILRHFFN